MKLNFSRNLEESEIVGRLLGPDLHGGYSVAMGVEPQWDRFISRERGRFLAEVGCVVTVRPVDPKELASSAGRVTTDEWGQPWLLAVRDGDA